jgi:hypothetical protein
MHEMNSTRRRAGRLALAAVALMALAGPVFALSADAQKVVDQVKKANPNLHPVCSDQAKLKSAVTEATKTLYEAKALSGDPHAAGEEAGKYLYTNCPS